MASRRLGPDFSRFVLSSVNPTVSGNPARLAAREGEGLFYRLGDGRGALLPALPRTYPLAALCARRAGEIGDWAVRQGLQALAFRTRERGLQRFRRCGAVAATALLVEVHRRAVQAQEQYAQLEPRSRCLPAEA